MARQIKINGDLPESTEDYKKPNLSLPVGTGDNSMAWNAPTSSIGIGMDNNVNELSEYPDIKALASAYKTPKDYEIGDPDNNTDYFLNNAFNKTNASSGYGPGDPDDNATYKGSLAALQQINKSNQPSIQPFSYASAPAYASKYQNQINELTAQILGRGPFEYDVNKDPLYAQYADQYTRNGTQAMKDTLGQISARTGGLASTYAGSAAQQTYDGYMQALADKVPELYQLAYSMYQDEDARDRNNLSLLQNLEAADYSRYKDQLSQYNANRNQAYNQYQDQLSALAKESTDSSAPSLDGYDDYTKNVLTLMNNFGMSASDAIKVAGDRPKVDNTEPEMSKDEKKYYATSMGLSDAVAYDWYLAAKDNAMQGETKAEAKKSMEDAGLNSKDIKTILNRINYD